ncbi:hypothetical protein DY000_02029685 [Brassica cretica]|uniref:Uncharacterized protein n=1 Tax=Brassica cretica TaxID=69181 RepID=A0ABQ7DUD3_BRACR|nr:hypothetical protein DY000_02029685 [Brassica cretica]
MPITDIIRDIQVGSSIKDNDAIITGCDSDVGNINMHILDDLSSYLQILIPLVIGLSPASRSSDNDSDTSNAKILDREEVEVSHFSVDYECLTNANPMFMASVRQLMRGQE